MGIPSASQLPLTRPETSLIIGACSGIAQSWMNIRAAKGDRLLLVARDEERLKLLSSHLRIKYQIVVEYWVLDCTEIEEQHRVIDRVFSSADTPVARVFVAIGLLGNESASSDWERARSILEVNFTSVVSLLSKIAPKLVAQGSGTIICLSSVAGDRGRATNLVYGAAKSGLTAYLSGLRNSLSDTPIRVMTVKPGPVDTAMTAGLKKTAIFASPDRVACDIDRADRKGQLVVYTPGWWRLVMFVIRGLPERFFMRLRF